MDKIKQIEAFVNATEKGSLAKAALGQGVTPVMLGRRIDALERRLGIKLMHRTTRHLTPVSYTHLPWADQTLPSRDTTKARSPAHRPVDVYKRQPLVLILRLAGNF